MIDAGIAEVLEWSSTERSKDLRMRVHDFADILLEIVDGQRELKASPWRVARLEAWTSRWMWLLPLVIVLGSIAVAAAIARSMARQAVPVIEQQFDIVTLVQRC